MTKTVSLADDAYEALVTVKQPGESFSDLARRLARLAAQDQVFRRTDEPATWSDEEAEELKLALYLGRDESIEPRTRMA